MKDTPAEKGVKLDVGGTALSAAGLGLIVLGILRSGTWGFVQPKPGAPEWFGLSPVIWLIFAGAAALGLFVVWENRRIARGEGALIDPGMLRNIQLRGGVISFFFMFMVMAGLFFAIPLFLSISLGLSAIETGVRLLPLSLSLLLFAAGIPRLLPERLAAARRPPRASSACSPGSCSWSACSTSGPGRRSSPGRCYSRAPGSARWPPSSAR